MFDVGNQIITKKTMGHHILDLSAETKMDFAAPSPWPPGQTPRRLHPINPTGAIPPHWTHTKKRWNCVGLKTQRQLAPLRVPNQPKSEGNWPIFPTSLRPVSCTETYYPGYPWFLVLPHLQSVTVLIWEHWSVLAVLKPDTLGASRDWDPCTHMLHVWYIYQHLPSKSPSFVGK